jgi:hypothetical protein
MRQGGCDILAGLIELSTPKNPVPSWAAATGAEFMWTVVTWIVNNLSVFVHTLCTVVPGCTT